MPSMVAIVSLPAAIGSTVVVARGTPSILSETTAVSVVAAVPAFFTCTMKVVD